MFLLLEFHEPGLRIHGSHLIDPLGSKRILVQDLQDCLVSGPCRMLYILLQIYISPRQFIDRVIIAPKGNASVMLPFVVGYLIPKGYTVPLARRQPVRWFQFP